MSSVTNLLSTLGIKTGLMHRMLPYMSQRHLFWFHHTNVSARVVISAISNSIIAPTTISRLLDILLSHIHPILLRILTLNAPRKTASENVVCLCRLLNILANFSNLFFAYRQTVWTLIRLLLKEQSDLGPHCLQQ